MDVIVKIRGGLGNQLFQYTMAKRVAIDNGADKIILDTSYFNSPHIRGLNIDKYSLPLDVEIVNKSNRWFDLFYFFYRITDKMALKITKKHRSESWLFSSLGFYFCDKTLNKYPTKITKKQVFLAGYFQDEKMCRDIRKSIISDLTIIENPSDRMIEYKRAILTNGQVVAVSIRIGEDYKMFGWPVCSRAFYEKGVERISTQTGSRSVFVFSDRIDLVEQEKWFEGYDVTYVSGCNSVESLDLLKSCHHFVIANSTFSWWGAYLSEYRDKMIVAPKFFYAGIEMTQSNIALPNAVYLDNNSGE